MNKFTSIFNVAIMAAALSSVVAAPALAGVSDSAGLGGPVTVSDSEDVPNQWPLVATHWTVEGVVKGETVIPAPKTVKEAYFSISAAGRLQASDGCNRIMGTAKITGRTITFKDVVATGAVCSGPDADVRRLITAVLLADEVTYTIVGDQLHLTRTPLGPELLLKAGLWRW